MEKTVEAYGYAVKLHRKNDRMEFVYADYNSLTNCVDITTYENYILRIDCGIAEQGLHTTPNSQHALDVLALDNPLEYVELPLSSQLQVFVDAEDNLISW